MRKMQLRHAVGQFLIVGLSGLELTPTERAWLRILRPAGIILFRRNIETMKQTQQLLKEATELCVQPAFHFVDLEGGLVDRLRDAFLPMPSAQEVAATGKAKLMYQHGLLIAREIRAFGFNTTLAPVLDLGLPESAPVMRTRTAAADSAGVVQYVSEFLTGIAKENVLGCGKHFPGLGGGTLDSHEATPEIERSFAELWNQDLLPYRELSRKLPIVMISHAAYPQTKGKHTPASVSRYWIQEILRKKIGYKGLILSDDMEMGGILEHMSIEDASIASVEAGTDLVEICKSPDLIFRSYEALLSKAEQSASFAKLITTHAQQINAQQRKMLKLFKPLTVTQKTEEKLKQDAQRFLAKVRTEEQA